MGGCNLEPDPAFLRKLEAVPGQPFSSTQAEARDDMLRRHFFDLTLAFLCPFVPYLTQPVTSADHAVAAPSLDGTSLTSPPGFDEDIFMATFQPVGAFAILPRGRCCNLYERFIHGANFHPWFARQRERITQRRGNQATCVTPAVNVPSIQSTPCDEHEVQSLSPLQAEAPSDTFNPEQIQ